jgi:dipeptidase D
MQSNTAQFKFLTGLVPVLAIMTLLYSAPMKATNPSGTQDAPPAMINDGESTNRILAIFEKMSQIPRCSKHEERISSWLVDWAKKRSFPVKTDERRNVLISVPASKGHENHPVIVLQAHMDMVCQKTDNSLHDFAKDPIILVRDGDWLHAKDTTLGADDGIGIALALALAEDTNKPRPPLELLLTTDEEIDMTGANGLSKDFLTGKKYINIDSEVEGAITLGSAGGVKSDLTLPLTFSALAQNQLVFSLRIDGLLGGHSGLEINKNRANANVLIAKSLSGKVPFRMIQFSGGTADNAITRTSEMIFALPPDQVDTLKTRLATFEQETRKQYPDEKNLLMTLTPVENRPDQAASETDSAKVVKLIMEIPQGVYDWSKEFTGLPETSNNIGIVKTGNNTVNITTFQRSFNPEKLEEIAKVIETAAANAGAASVRRSSFPTWPPKADSDLYKKSLAAYQQLFKTPLKTEVLHAGLECGYIAEKYPDMEIISIGPTLENVHTPRERLYVPSLEKVSQFMNELLRNL